MKNTLLTFFACVALASFAAAQAPSENSTAKKPAPIPQEPAASGTTNGGDVDRSVPQVDHGTQKTAPEAKESNDKATKSEAKGSVKPAAGKSNPSVDKEQPKAERDHGVDKSVHPDPKDGTDPAKDAKTEDKTKSDKVTDHQHGTEKQKS